MEKLQRLLACMRMVCDTPYILDSNCRICPKLGELASVLEEVLQEEKTKVLVFSEWERMLQLVRDLSEQMRLDFAWHTGSVSQKRRRKEIHRFKEDPDCRLFLSTDSGSTGLNLQAANVVINMDLPWNPARLEQRIARAWRKHQTRPVSVVHLVAEKSIEHRMLSTLAHKQQLADGVVDGIGEVKAMPLTSGRAAFVERLEALMGEPVEAERVAAPRAEPATVRKDPYETYRDDLAARISDRLLLMEARKDAQGKESMFVVVDGDVEQVRPLASRLLKQNFPGAEGEQVNLEMIDRSTYATIQRLVNSGVLNINSQAARQVYATDTLAESRRKEQQRRFEEAREVFKKAERKWKMGLVLRDGGFAIEALSPLREASEITLKALCRLQGAADTSEDPLPLQHVEMILSQTSLPETALTTIEYLRDINDSGRDVNEEEACRLVRDADRLVLGARQIISKAALE
jgi:superfamily II DNA/RNA helicase